MAAPRVTFARFDEHEGVVRASGVFCVGCCWALMLLMLITTVQHVGLMPVLGLVMAVEKNVR